MKVASKGDTIKLSFDQIWHNQLPKNDDGQSRISTAELEHSAGSCELLNVSKKNTENVKNYEFDFGSTI